MRASRTYKARIFRAFVNLNEVVQHPINNTNAIAFLRSAIESRLPSPSYTPGKCLLRYRFLILPHWFLEFSKPASKSSHVMLTYGISVY